MMQLPFWFRIPRFRAQIISVPYSVNLITEEGFLCTLKNGNYNNWNHHTLDIVTDGVYAQERRLGSCSQLPSSGSGLDQPYFVAFFSLKEKKNMGLRYSPHFTFLS